MSKVVKAVLTAAVMVLALALQSIPQASAVNAPLDRLVNPVPSAGTPNILNGQVWSLAEMGDYIIAGGSFSSVAPPGQTTGAVERNHIVAFDSITGQIAEDFNPALDGTVFGLEPGPSADTVYVAGSFTHVNGQAQRGLALLDLRTGQEVNGFNPPNITGGHVVSVERRQGRLYIGGTFGTVGGQEHNGLATLDPQTGALDSYMDLQLAGRHGFDRGGSAKGPTGVKSMDITPDGSRMVVVGNFTSVSGADRDQIAMVDLNSGAPSVDTNWSTQAFTAACFDWAFDSYMRGVDFAPDGSFFVVVATGGSGTNDDGTNSSCDTASRYETNETGSDVRPTWIDYTGQDTLSSVAVTDAAVYIGGHMRWMNNSSGHDRAQQGAVPRPGLAALDPHTGVPLGWNPGRNPRGAGAYSLLATDRGVYVGDDTPWIGNRKYLREGVAFFPLAGGRAVATPNTQQLPANVFLAGPLASTDPADVLFRVNAGGPAISTGSGPAWLADQSDVDPGAQYRNTGSSASGWSSGAGETGNVPASTPNAIYDSERWDAGSQGDGGEMQWHFPVAAGTDIEVRLYFANRYSGTSQPGQRVFDVSLEGQTVLPNYDIVQDVGDQTGTMKAFDITSDGQVDIDFTHEVENPLINGIEIVKQDPGGGPTVDGSALLERPFDGTTAGSTSTWSDTGIDWSQIDGAFMVNDTLFYGGPDGKLHSRSFDGDSFGSPTTIDPYNDPDWSDVDTGSGQTYRGLVPTLYNQLGSVSGMFYLDGKVYYTLSGDSRLYSRWFSPDSGILGSDTFTLSGGGLNTVAGMFYSDGHIYYADRGTGELKRVDFTGDAIDSSTTATVSGPSVDGNDWRSQDMFLYGSPEVPNRAPTAVFSVSCDQNVCSFDGSGSSDPDADSLSYAWSFGDGSSGSGAQVSHAYAEGGTVNVTLTVSDPDGASDVVTHQASPSDPPEETIGFVGVDHSGDGAAKSKSVTMPAAAEVGDTAVLFFTQASNIEWGGPSGGGWSQVGTFDNGSLTSSLWKKTVSAGDPGGAVTMNTDTYSKASLSLSVYSGVDASIMTTAHAGDSRTSEHVTPTLDVSTGDVVVSYWGDKGPGTTEWTPPSGVTVRDTAVGSGTGRYGFLLADSGGGVPAGSYGGLTATTDATSGKATMWTVALTPAGPSAPNRTPTAVLSVFCDQNVCSFDGSGSSDPDSDSLSYAWSFGDGSSGSGAQVSHAYSQGGDVPVTLTVTDPDGASDAVTDQASPSAPPVDVIGFVASDHSGDGAAKSKSVNIPAAAQAGDIALLFFTQAQGVEWSGPSGDGWSQVQSFDNGSLTSTLWKKTVSAGDPGLVVTMQTGDYSKASLSLSVYSNVDPSRFLVEHAGDARTSEHVTPALDVSTGDVVVSYWADKSPGTTQWSAPTGVAVRDTAVGSGAGRYGFLLADSNGSVSAGSYRRLTATTDSTSGRAVMWTVGLTPAG